MKKKILSYLKKLINWLQVKYDNYSHNNEDCFTAYNALSPIDNVENNEDYETALTWALKNRKKNDIKNIALTGSYGSGKSSILKTFQKKYIGSDFHFLTISLATFKEELKNKNGNSNLSNEDESNNTIKLESEYPDKKESLLRLIELSILQQIFYHEEDEKIPDSRFKKIKNYKKKTLFITAFFIFIFLFSLINIGYPDLLKKLFKINQINLVFEMIFYFFTLSILIIGGFVMILKSIRILNSIRISKLNIQNAEIEINDKVSKSILNHHIDEILYFFEVRPYNIVIIEDLDRFKETEIFTKLREVNLLINNSNKIKKEVVFIYAVRDDMFEDKDRIKFFDFIIPVIPVINSSNSSQKLLDKNKLNNYELSEDLIENISLFIDDMRLLHNITNEFYLYFKKLNKKNLNPDKLLSILVYKNIFPNDFTLLSNSDGLLFNAINSKQNYIDAYESEIDVKIKEIKENIINIENLNITDLEELRSIYILRFVSQLNNFSSFKINNSNYSPYELASEELFEYLINNEVKYENYFAPYTHSSSYQVRVTNLSVTFNTIEKEVSSVLYNERVQLINDLNSDKIEVLKGQLQEIEKEKLQARNLKVSELLLNGNVDFRIKDENQHKLVSILLRNGYIAEDYLDYISIFYEGSITKQDHYFILNVKSQVITGFDYKLIKIDKLISKINIIDFGKDYILNYNLVDFILSKPKYKAHSNSIFNKLKDESEISIKFIDGFLGVTTKLKPFVQKLCKNWENIWFFIDELSNYTRSKKDDYFKYILQSIDINDIPKISKNSSFIYTILSKKDFLNIMLDESKLKKIIEVLNLKFISINFREAPKELINYIYENNYYEVNNDFVKFYIKQKGDFNQIEYDTSNYLSIKNSKCVELIDYINKNINDYIKNIYLKIETNVNEDENTLIELLNNENLLIEHKEEIIKKVKTKINSLSAINIIEIDYILLEEFKIIESWENVCIFYNIEDERITLKLISFISDKAIANELSKQSIPKDIDEEDSYQNFSMDLVGCNDISDESYQLLLKSIPYKFDNFSLNNLSETKARLVINSGILLLTVENYDMIREDFVDLHILLLEKFNTLFSDNISSYILDTSDVQKLLNSNELSDTQKFQIIKEVDVELINENTEILNIIGNLILQNRISNIRKVVTDKVLLNSKLSIDQRVSLLLHFEESISNEDLTLFLNSIGNPYSSIAINGKKPLIDNSITNKKLVKILISKSYIKSTKIEKNGIRISTFRK